ncbi:MAG: excalibur calcium-binding domain-containing protein [Lachnospiraceae bacterium]|nr:excalibur calcium-binding domain-containing protein [Lachnospiraceae bacterium]
MDHGAKRYRRYLDGDNDGLKEIVETYFDGLMQYLNLFVRNLSEAEELAEETLFQLISKRTELLHLLRGINGRNV